MKVNYLIILSAILLTTSCNKWLDVAPKTEVAAKEMFRSEQGYIDVLNGCYFLMGSNELYGAAMSYHHTEILAKLYFASNIQENGLREYDYTKPEAQMIFKQMYGGLYKIAVQANMLLQNIESSEGVFSNERIKNCIKGEALAIRAYMHLDILRLFGQMPQNPMTEVKLPYQISVKNSAATYYSYKDYVDMLEKDLLKAEELLFSGDDIVGMPISKFDMVGSPINSTRRLHLNYYAVKALQARFYNYIGNKQKAIDAAKVVIDAKSSPTSNVVTLANITYYFGVYVNTFPSEGLFYINVGSKIIDYYNNNMFPKTITEVQFNHLYGSWSTTNNRKALWINNYGRVVHTKYKPVDFSKAYSTNLAMEVAAKSVIGLRLSECFLIVMENTTSLEELNNYYNIYMTSHGEANLPAFTSLTDYQTKDNICLEYAREFAGEGQLFFTYKRLSMKNIIFGDGITMGEEQYVLPVPASEYETSK